jgi:hypothetical protein
MEVSGQPLSLYSRYRCTGGWKGRRVGLDVMENKKILCSYQKSNPVSSVA